MGSLEVAVMEPKYQQNLGYIARVSKNFGVGRLILIRPRCNHTGRDSIKYSKHARDLLEGAKISKGIGEIDADLLIGTTGVWHKTNASYYNVYSIGRLSGIAKRMRSSKGKTVVLLGRDDTGLSREELRECDATIFIASSPEYPVLNISHALAIILNALSSQDRKYGFMGEIYAGRKAQSNLIRLFDRSLAKNPRIRDRKSVSLAFRHILGRSVPTRKEVNALSIALAGANEDGTSRRRKKN